MAAIIAAKSTFRSRTFSTPTPDFNNQLRCSLSLRCYSAGMNPHESAFAESFISKARRERALELLASSKNRHKFTSKFDHHGRDYFIPECIRSIEPRHLLFEEGAYRTTTTSMIFFELEEIYDQNERLVALPGIEPGFED